MSFAGDYLQKHALRGPLIDTPPQADLHCIVVIPAYKEPGLITCLGSLFLCDPPGVQVEVIVLINAHENSGEDAYSINKLSLEVAEDWKTRHQRADIAFHLIMLDDLPHKHAGAGLARKLVMDEAVRRFEACDNKQGIIMSLDADTKVDQNYLQAVVSYLSVPEISGCSIYFEHPLEDTWDDESGDDWQMKLEKSESGNMGMVYSQEVYDAIANYELHLRYYLHAVRLTGYPFAYHTVGSCFAVKADTYCRQGGMNKRQAGEDFYFIQKVARLGSWSDCTTTTVHPSPRPSDRVVFGTGPDIRRQLDNPASPYMTYNLELFEMLREFFAFAGKLFVEDQAMPISKNTLLAKYLLQTKYTEVIHEIRANAASEKTFTARFFRHFNMLWILKFLHWAEGNGVAKVELGEAGKKLLGVMGLNAESGNVRTYLAMFREIDQKNA